jgi:hypothetical protein
MRIGRRHRGFERAGRVPARELGLPRAQAAQLVLAAEWRRVAGAAIAQRASAIAIRRGVLEIELHDERWRETLTSLLPNLASRLATRCPDLGVRKFLLRAGDSRPETRPSPVPEIEEPAERVCATPVPIETGSTGEVSSERLAAAMERYLARGARRSSR